MGVGLVLGANSAEMRYNKTMDKAAELLNLFRTGTYTNDQFWEAQDLLNALPSRDWTDIHVRLQALWCEAEETRIAAGTHRGPDDKLTHNGRFWA